MFERPRYRRVASALKGEGAHCVSLKFERAPPHGLTPTMYDVELCSSGEEQIYFDPRARPADPEVPTQIEDCLTASGGQA